VGEPEPGPEVTEKQARILRHLDERDPTMVGELADFLGVTPSTMSLNLKRLEAMGCVHRSRDPDDRRVMNVRLTATGGRIKVATSPLHLGRLDSVLGSLRPDERARAVEGVRLLVDAAERMTARGEAYLEALTGEDAVDGRARVPNEVTES